MFTQSLETNELGIAIATLNRVNPGRTYVYKIIADGEMLVEQFFTTPIFFQDIQQPPAFSVGVIGNHYVREEGAEPPYQNLGSHYDIFPALQNQGLSGIIWAGSSTFLREMDLTSRSGILRRHAHNRAHSSTRSLFANIWHKATPGDGAFVARHTTPIKAPTQWAREGFSQYWPSAAAFHQAPPHESPLYHSFRWADTEFFFIDSQSERSGYSERIKQPALFSDAQRSWLLTSLADSTAAFKVVVSSTSMLSPVENAFNYAEAVEHKEAFFQALDRNRVDGLIFVSGGKHFGELTKTVRPRGYNLFELSVGSTTYLDPDNPAENNYFREPLTSSENPQYGRISVNGDEENREIALSLFDIDGGQIFERKIPRTDLTWTTTTF